MKSVGLKEEDIILDMTTWKNDIQLFQYNSGDTRWWEKSVEKEKKKVTKQG